MSTAVLFGAAIGTGLAVTVFWAPEASATPPVPRPAGRVPIGQPSAPRLASTPANRIAPRALAWSAP